MIQRPGPGSRRELLATLCAIFPAFEAQWQAEAEDDPFPGDSLHGVYQSFLPWVSGADVSQEQLQELAVHINDAVAAGGDCENAVATCVLEHLDQVGMRKALRPLLSAESRERMRP